MCLETNVKIKKSIQKIKKQQIIFRKELVHHQREIEKTIGSKMAREMELKKEITHLRSMKNSHQLVTLRS